MRPQSNIQMMRLKTNRPIASLQYIARHTPWMTSLGRELCLGPGLEPYFDLEPCPCPCPLHCRCSSHLSCSYSESAGQQDLAEAAVTGLLSRPLQHAAFSVRHRVHLKSSRSKFVLHPEIEDPRHSY